MSLVSVMTTVTVDYYAFLDAGSPFHIARPYDMPNSSLLSVTTFNSDFPMSATFPLAMVALIWWRRYPNSSQSSCSGILLYQLLVSARSIISMSFPFFPLLVCM